MANKVNSYVLIDNMMTRNVHEWKLGMKKWNNPEKPIVQNFAVIENGLYCGECMSSSTNTESGLNLVNNLKTGLTILQSVVDKYNLFFIQLFLHGIGCNFSFIF